MDAVLNYRSGIVLQLEGNKSKTFIQTFFSHASSTAMSVCLSVHHFGQGLNIPTSIQWIAMKFYIDIHGPQRMNHIDFGDPRDYLQQHHEVHTCGFE